MQGRDLLYARQQGYCWACGVGLEAVWHDHHRKRRRDGGDGLGNRVALHPRCHNLGQEGVHLRPEWARERGLIVPSWGDPYTQPVWLPDGSRVLLDDAGTAQMLLL